MDFIKKAYLRAEIDKLYSDFIYLQQCAITENKIYSLNFNEKLSNYSYNGHVHRFSSGIEFGVLSGVLGPPSKPNKLMERGITFKGSKILFHPTGAVQPGMVSLVNRSIKNMFSISISASNISSIKKYSYENVWVELK